MRYVLFKDHVIISYLNQQCNAVPLIFHHMLTKRENDSLSDRMSSSNIEFYLIDMFCRFTVLQKLLTVQRKLLLL